MALKLTDRQLQRLLEIAAAQSVGKPLGYMGTSRDKSLLRHGLISIEEKKIPFIGNLMMTSEIALMTPEGHRYIGACGFAPFPNEEKFLSKRRIGYCDATYEPFVSCLAKGWIEIIETRDAEHWVKWKKTKAGNAVCKITRSQEEQELIDSVT